MKAYLVLIRMSFCFLSRVAPRLAGKVAFNLFQRPMNRVTRPLERSFFKEAKHFKIDHYPEAIDCYEVGNPEGDLIFLVHGWESNAGSMAAIATSLADQGYRVISFDLPAHGHSKLKRANILTCSNALDRVMRYFQYSGSPSIVSHSFGSAVSTYTLARKGYQINKFIMLSTPDRILDIFQDFKNIISLGDTAFKTMLDQVKALVGEDLETIAVNRMAEKVQYQNLSIIHDQYDRILPYSNSVNVYKNAPKATLTTVEKIGHYKMLWNNSVIGTILYELNGERDKVA